MGNSVNTRPRSEQALSSEDIASIMECSVYSVYSVHSVSPSRPGRGVLSTGGAEEPTLFTRGRYTRYDTKSTVRALRVLLTVLKDGSNCPLGVRVQTGRGGKKKANVGAGAGQHLMQ